MAAQKNGSGRGFRQDEVGRDTARELNEAGVSLMDATDRLTDAIGNHPRGGCRCSVCSDHPGWQEVVRDLMGALRLFSSALGRVNDAI